MKQGWNRACDDRRWGWPAVATSNERESEATVPQDLWRGTVAKTRMARGMERLLGVDFGWFLAKFGLAGVLPRLLEMVLKAYHGQKWNLPTFLCWNFLIGPIFWNSQKMKVGRTFWDGEVYKHRYIYTVIISLIILYPSKTNPVSKQPFKPSSTVGVLSSLSPLFSFKPCWITTKSTKTRVDSLVSLLVS